MQTGHGTKFTGPGQQNPRRRSLKSADQSGRLMLVWLRFPPSLRSANLVGRLKQSLNMHMTGLLRNEGLIVSMPTHIVVGFSRILLNEEEAALAMNLARKKDRYLVPAEISLLLKKDLKKEVQDHELKSMQATWLDFCKEKNLDQETSLTEIEPLELWWDYVAKNYHAALPDPTSPWDN